MISALVICKNEEKHIARCLASLIPVADEIIVLDSGSEDQTISIAQSLGVRVVQTTWQGFAATKNYGHSLVTHSYILSLDADEVLSESLQQAILSIKENLHGAYAMSRRTNYCGQWIRHAGWYPDVKVRLFPKETYWEGDFVHEKPVLPAGTHVQKLNGDLLHYSIENLEDHLERVQRYSQLKADAYYAEGKSYKWYKAWFNPVIVFLKMYVFKLGFLEGKRGFQLCRVSAYGAYLRQKKLRAKK
jgi:glycosyltransferase involved in cell wall biosynthesis